MSGSSFTSNTGLPMIIIGVALPLLGQMLDLSGFFKGLLIGCGIVLVVFGVFILRHRPSDEPWLPSRDQDHP